MSNRRFCQLGRVFGVIGRLTTTPAWFREKLAEALATKSVNPTQIPLLLIEYERVMALVEAVDDLSGFEQLLQYAQRGTSTLFLAVVDGYSSLLNFCALRAWLWLKTLLAEEPYVRFRLALTALDYSGHVVSPHRVYAYRRADSSPSGRVLAASLPEDDPRCRKLLTTYKPTL